MSKDSLICPITFEVFRDPVVAEDGHTYERQAITDWIKKDGTSPITRQKLTIDTLRPNYTVKKIVEEIENNQQQKSHKVSSAQNDDTKIPCEFCDELVELSKYETHTNRCFQKETDRTDSRMQLIPSEKFTEMVLCENCNQSYDVSHLDQHKRMCLKYPVNQKQSSRSTVDSILAALRIDNKDNPVQQHPNLNDVYTNDIKSSASPFCFNVRSTVESAPRGTLLSNVRNLTHLEYRNANQRTTLNSSDNSNSLPNQSIDNSSYTRSCEYANPYLDDVNYYKYEAHESLNFYRQYSDCNDTISPPYTQQYEGINPYLDEEDGTDTNHRQWNMRYNNSHSGHPDPNWQETTRPPYTENCEYPNPYLDEYNNY
ncbi:unnamed protein product [Didymodactylos carnosus]|uniref:U-box domain-containing protein n=1 Tax=Didymodactylos carnosus TaxID=1234261 RepID=A0A814U9C9_9BILA|nr:unnamed protein product [Didymodactylos carnosus]CAF3932788.1 unnamed protein product [Didymodactylos carnosus]